MKKEFLRPLIICGSLFIIGCILQAYFPKVEVTLGSAFLVVSLGLLLYDLKFGK